ncbi:MAG TPA: hypothetical protein VM694_34470 [Polyangium sp.]|nr:hypothetical protein [Polyangium sp.]
MSDVFAFSSSSSSRSCAFGSGAPGTVAAASAATAGMLGTVCADARGDDAGPASRFAMAARATACIAGICRMTVRASSSSSSSG